MKRPLAVAGLLYFAALSVAFRCPSVTITAVLAGGALLAAAGAVVFRIVSHKRRVHLTVLIGSVSVLCALSALLLFQQVRVQPVMDAYAGKTVRVTGYAGDAIQIKDAFVTYTLHCDTADGQPADFAVSYTTRSGYDIEPFDKLAVTLTPEPTTYDYSRSKGVYLYAYEEDGADLVLTGDKHFTPYAWAVALRQHWQHTLNRLLSPDAAGVASAVLLGNKAALPDDMYRAFVQTGTSYLIVVSGMHLAVVTLLLRRLFRRFERFHVWLPFIGIALLTFLFMAVTGFNASVKRAGCMLLITYIGKIIFRDSDGFTSLGVAALLLTLFDPYAVGDNGMVLSFAATFGILLWANPIGAFCIEKLHLTQKFIKKPTRRDRAEALLKHAGRICVAFLSTSLTATLWVMPLSVLLFERISPLTVLISVAAYPLSCAVLLLSFVLVLLPFLSVPLAWLIHVFAGWLVAVEQWSAALPFTSVPADQIYCYVWLAGTGLLVLCGYLFRRGRRYVAAATVASVLMLTIGGAVTALTADNAAHLTVWRIGSGYTAMVRKGSNVSLLSCGGTGKGKSTVTGALERTELLDNVLVTGSFRQNAAFLPWLLEEKRIANLLVYDSLHKDERIKEDTAVWFGDNTRFPLALNSEVTLDVLCTDKKVFRYVRAGSVSVLFVPKKADTAQLPAALRRADVVLAERDADLSAVTARRVLRLTDSDSGEMLQDGDVFELRLSH